MRHGVLREMISLQSSKNYRKLAVCGRSYHRTASLKIVAKQTELFLNKNVHYFNLFTAKIQQLRDLLVQTHVEYYNGNKSTSFYVNREL